MNDQDLSLAVAMIMWPEYEWEICDGKVTFNNHITDHPIYGGKGNAFNHSTDDALGKMCVWLANNAQYNADILFIDHYLKGDNPHRAIAEEIVKIGAKS